MGRSGTSPKATSTSQWPKSSAVDLHALPLQRCGIQVEWGQTRQVEGPQKLGDRLQVSMRNHPNIKAFVLQHTWKVALNGELFCVKSNPVLCTSASPAQRFVDGTNKPESLVNGGISGINSMSPELRRGVIEIHLLSKRR